MNLVPSQRPLDVWEKFAAAHGPEVIAKAYRAGLPVRGERVWEAWDGDALIGWGSLVEDAFDPNTYMYRAGVFPGHERRGYRHKIRSFLAMIAFSRPGVHYVTYGALLGNQPQCRRLFLESKTGTWGQYSGMTLLPKPGMMHFVLTRERWDSLGGTLYP